MKGKNHIKPNYLNRYVLTQLPVQQEDANCLQDDRKEGARLPGGSKSLLFSDDPADVAVCSSTFLSLSSCCHFCLETKA